MASVYDPVKAHDYYERTKHLQGRKPGAGRQPQGRPKAAQAQKNAQQKVAEIRAKLDRLRALLREKEASERKSKAPEHKNASQKAADAQKDKEYYDKHKQEIKNNRTQAAKSGGGGGKTAADMSADELRSAIRNTVTQLKKAIAAAQQARGGPPHG